MTACGEMSSMFRALGERKMGLVVCEFRGENWDWWVTVGWRKVFNPN